MPNYIKLVFIGDKDKLQLLDHDKYLKTAANLNNKTKNIFVENKEYTLDVCAVTKENKLEERLKIYSNQHPTPSSATDLFVIFFHDKNSLDKIQHWNNELNLSFPQAQKILIALYDGKLDELMEIYGKTKRSEIGATHFLKYSYNDDKTTKKLLKKLCDIAISYKSEYQERQQEKFNEHLYSFKINTLKILDNALTEIKTILNINFFDSSAFALKSIWHEVTGETQKPSTVNQNILKDINDWKETMSDIAKKEDYLDFLNKLTQGSPYPKNTLLTVNHREAYQALNKALQQIKAFICETIKECYSLDELNGLFTNIKNITEDLVNIKKELHTACLLNDKQIQAEMTYNQISNFLEKNSLGEIELQELTPQKPNSNVSTNSQSISSENTSKTEDLNEPIYTGPNPFN